MVPECPMCHEAMVEIPCGDLSPDCSHCYGCGSYFECQTPGTVCSGGYSPETSWARSVETDREGCTRCGFPFADPDITVLFFGSDPNASPTEKPTKAYHVTCFNEIAGGRGWLVAAIYHKSPVPEALLSEGKEFNVYVGKAATCETPTLRTSEVRKKWPAVGELIEAQRVARMGRNN